MALVSSEKATPRGEDWTGLCASKLPAADVSDWLVRDDCGASVVFTGTTRDRSEGRTGVSSLTYEAYESEVDRRLDAVVNELRGRWPEAARVAILHRTGEVALGEAAVVVGVSSAHRDVAFEAARYGIDAVKATVPIWKQEHHSAGADWGVDGAELLDAREVSPGWSDSDRTRNWESGAGVAS